jgi:hypothetical protein
VNEDVFATSFLLNKAETLFAIEEFDHAFAGANNLSRHPVKTATSASATTRTAAWTPTTAAAKTITTTRAAVITESAATAAAATAEPVSATAKIVAGRKIVAAAEWIEAVFTESVAFISAPAAPSIVTHNRSRTLSLRPVASCIRNEGGQP